MAYVFYFGPNGRYVEYSEKKEPYFSSFYDRKEEFFVFSGELHKVENKFINKKWEINTQYLLIDESFSLVKYDKTKSCLFFANSKIGLEPIFYYKTKDVFIISDDFWSIAKIIRPNKDDLDKDSILEYLNLPYALFD